MRGGSVALGAVIAALGAIWLLEVSDTVDLDTGVWVGILLVGIGVGVIASPSGGARVLLIVIGALRRARRRCARGHERRVLGRHRRPARVPGVGRRARGSLRAGIGRLELDLDRARSRRGHDRPRADRHRPARRDGARGPARLRRRGDRSRRRRRPRRARRRLRRRPADGRGPRRRRRAPPRARGRHRRDPGPRRALARHPAAGLLEHLAEDPRHLVELLLARDERRGDLDHRVAAVVGAADQPALEQGRPRGSRAGGSRIPRRRTSRASPCPSRARARRRSPSREGRRRSGARAAAPASRGRRPRARARPRRSARAS